MEDYPGSSLSFLPINKGKINKPCHRVVSRGNIECTMLTVSDIQGIEESEITWGRMGNE